MSKITFSQATQGYLLAAGARHLSEHTIRDYVNTLKKFSNFLDEDLPIEEITRHHIEAFFAAQTKVSNKTILNYHVGLSALWTWAASEHIVPTHVVREVTPPKPEQKEIIPFSVVEIRAMLAVVGRDASGQVLDKRMKYTSDRNRTIILLLLDTGMRASELCGLDFSHVGTHNRRLRVMGKGAKERTIPFSPRTGQALWRYLTALCCTYELNLSGVSKVHPHRFRHTFAIQYIRNGGDPYTLQALLGHSSLGLFPNSIKVRGNSRDQRKEQ
jgi:integrase/recombinase XerD